MKSNWRMRLAVPADAAAVADVLRQSFREFAPLYTPNGYAATTPDQWRVQSRMEEGPVWVALLEDRIVGTASAVLKCKDGLYVRGVAVLPSVRGQGIAEALLNEIEAFARGRGYGRLFLTTTPFLESAIRLYQRFGFAATPDEAGDLFGTPLLAMAKELDSR